MHKQILTPEDSSGVSPSGLAAVGSATSGEHTELLEQLYGQWKSDPGSVDPTWNFFFEGFELGCQQLPVPRKPGAAPIVPATPLGDVDRLKQAHIYNLLFAYRVLGHYIADLDPLGISNNKEKAELELSHFKLSEDDLDTIYDSGTLAGGGARTLREIITILKATYCNTVGVEYMHMQNFTLRRWLRDRMEVSRNTPSFSKEKKKRVLNHLLEAEQFERFLHTRYVGQKRFSLEGGETLIPMLDALVEACPRHGVAQIVMGMSHRGRLNVLANVLGKDYKFLFNEFAENYIPQAVQGDGDVKYHLGFEATQTTSDGSRVGISLAPNPSHLEAVNGVVEGKTRAWQRLLHDTKERKKVLPVLIHGDAAFIGQGVVAETLNLSKLEGYRTGGTIHLVVNNQIGFTTSPSDGRSTYYCTALAKTLGAPIFHVNGDDPLAAVHLMELAFDIRQRFQVDVVIDLICYRRLGHNEGDEPGFTQPILYDAIDDHDAVSEILLRKLVASGEMNEPEAESYRRKFEEKLNDALAESKAAVQELVPAIRKPLSTPLMYEPFPTAVEESTIRMVGEKITASPSGFHLNPKLVKWLEHRRKMVLGEAPLDWAMAESLAFGTLLNEQVPVRLSGQDSRRGTFSHRHSVLYDAETRERYVPLRHISEKQSSFCVYNSPLSEFAVLGFDFGYSLDYPNMLCMWEAQFGDFANGAQVIIDQYITSSESKWGVNSGIVLLLPHGYDGQGPEHSSARMERFLQACAEDNIQVANCSTPANYFHILRRQGLRKATRKPLILMTPKGMLRDKRFVSSVKDLSSCCFQEILDDPTKPEKAKRVVLCSGKVYYDLVDYRTKTKQDADVAIIRLEQLYPLVDKTLKKVIEAYKGAKKIVWCQEESQNMGAWSFIEPRLRALFGQEITYAGRDASASPATGVKSIHELEQQDVMVQAFR